MKINLIMLETLIHDYESEHVPLPRDYISVEDLGVYRVERRMWFEDHVNIEVL